MSLLFLLLFCVEKPKQQFPPFQMPPKPGQVDDHPYLPLLVCINPFAAYSHEDALEQVRRHEAHLDWLARQKDIIQVNVSDGAYWVWKEETTNRKNKWEYLAKMLDPKANAVEKRTYLKWFKDTMFEDDFYHGRMPPPFPLIKYD